MEPVDEGTPVDRTSWNWLSWLAPVILLGLLLLFWEIWVLVRDTPDWFLPAPSDVARALADNWRILLDNAWQTLQAVILGFLLAVAAGVGIACLIDRSDIARRTIYPIVIVSQAIPVVALAPLFLVWFGHDLLPKVLMTALLAFFPITVATADGLGSADREMLQLIQSMGGSNWDQFRLVKLPGSMPAFFSGARVGIALAVVGATLGELMGSSSGLGHLIEQANATLQTDLVFAAIAVLSVMSILLFALVAIAERFALPWRKYVTA